MILLNDRYRQGEMMGLKTGNYIIITGPDAGPDVIPMDGEILAQAPRSSGLRDR